MTLGERIEALRKREGIAQAELARRVGISQSTMNSLIHGDSRTSRSLLALARELKTNPAYLTGETDDPSPGAAPSGLSSQDKEALELLHSMSAESRKTLMQFMRTVVHDLRAKAIAPQQPSQLQHMEG